MSLGVNCKLTLVDATAPRRRFVGPRLTCKLAPPSERVESPPEA